jgi:hypothetical protein
MEENSNWDHTDIELWKIKTQRYKQLGLYSQVVKKPMLHFSLENSEMANQVAIIVKILNMVQYHDTIRMVNFINPPSTIGIVVDLYPLYSASLQWYRW